MNPATFRPKKCNFLPKIPLDFTASTFFLRIQPIYWLVIWSIRRKKPGVLVKKYRNANKIFPTFWSWEAVVAEAAMEFSILAILAVRPRRREVILSVSSTWSLYLSHSLGAADCITLTVTPLPTSSLALVSAFRLADSDLSRATHFSRPDEHADLNSSKLLFVDLERRRTLVFLSIIEYHPCVILIHI